MSKPREPWWGYVKNVIRKYPAYKAALLQLKNQKITPGFSKAAGRGKTQRKTEAVALRELPPRDQQRYEAVDRALRKTRRLPDGDLRCRMIELTYFQKRLNMQGAANALHVSYGTVKIWHVQFVRLVADYLDLL